jgi:translation initiation factor 2 beta subunit (eIF-2beta)/eIF-5
MESFETMLNNVYFQLGEKQKIKLQIPQPQLNITTTNTYWKNVKDFLKKIKRSPEQFIDFLKIELGDVNWLSNSKSDGIVIIGKVRKDKIIKIIQKYMNKYVVCKSCTSNLSKITFDNTIKKYNFFCKDCLCEYNI